MSPLVWDLGHIAAFEDLWVCRRDAGSSCCGPTWPRSTTRPRRRAPSAATSRTCAALRRSSTWTRCASARWRTSTACCGRGSIWRDARPARASAQRDDAADAAAGRARLYSPLRVAPAGDGGAAARIASRGRAVRDGRRAAAASPTTTSARATTVELAAFEIDRAPVTNGAVPRVRRGRRLPAPELWSPDGLGVARARGGRAAALLERRRPRAPLRPRSWRSSRRCR